MTEEKKKPRPKVKPGAAITKTQSTSDRSETGETIADHSAPCKPKPKALTIASPVLVDSLKNIRYCTSREGRPTAPHIQAHTSWFEDFAALLVPGVAHKGPAIDTYTDHNGETRKLQVPVNGKTVNGYLAPYIKSKGIGNDGYVSQQAIMFDYDDAPVGTLAKLEKWLNKAGVWGCIYTTFNHMKPIAATAKKPARDALERMRLVVMLDKPVTGEDNADAMYQSVLARVALNDVIAREIPELEIDDSSFKPAQRMYLPPHNSVIVESKGRKAVSLAFLRQHFRKHKLIADTHGGSKNKLARVPDGVHDLYAPFIELLMQYTDVTEGRDGRLLVPASIEHASQYTSGEPKPDDFAFMPPLHGVAEVFNVGTIHDTDGDAIAQLKRKKAKKGTSAAAIAERNRLAAIRYCCMAVCDTEAEGNKLWFVLEKAITEHKALFVAEAEAATDDDMSDDEDDAPKTKKLPAVSVETRAQKVRDAAAISEAKLDGRITLVTLATGGVVTGLEWCYAILNQPDMTGYEVGYDQFMQTEMYREVGTQGWLPVTDNVRTLLQIAAEAVSRDIAATMDGVTATLRETDFNRALDLYAADHAFDSFQEWGRSLAWDGTERNTWITECFGAPDSEYTRAVGRYMLLAMAGRMLVPGCKVDMVPLLVGGEGTGKSTAIAALAPQREYFAEASPAMEPKELTRLLMGKTHIELSELETMRSMKDKGRLKMFITTQVDHNRRMNKNSYTQMPRRFTLWATSNPAQVLDAEGRQRRWLPLDAQQCSADHVRSIAPQLWAQAVAQFTPDALRAAADTVDQLAGDVREAHKEEHPLADALAEVMEELFADDGLTLPATSTNIMRALNDHVRSGAVGNAVVNKHTVAAALRILGYERGGKHKTYRKTQ